MIAKTRRHRFVAAAALFLFVGPTPAPAQEAFTNAIKAFLQDHIDLEKKNVGMVIGIVDESGSSVIHHGSVRSGSSGEVNGDTVFKICSVTKLFTALLLHEMVERGEVRLEDSISKYLPRTVKVPAWGGKEITLLHLATHTSGLSTEVTNLSPSEWANPYAGYTTGQLYAFLSGYALPREPGTKPVYSNVGYGLLGHVLCLAAGTNYETLVVERLCNPLEMSSTRVALTPELKARSAGGHTRFGVPHEDIEYPEFLMGKGALRSTVNDLLKFVSASLGFTRTELYSVMQKTHAARFKTQDLYSHLGGDFGFQSYVGFNKQTRRGVVILSNQGFDTEIDPLSLLLLNGEWRTDKRPKAIAIDPATLDSFTGQYEISPKCILGIRREGNRLMAQSKGRPVLELLPASENVFFSRLNGQRVTFVRNVRGRVESLISELDDCTSPSARRVSEQSPERWSPPKFPVIVTLSSSAYDACIGRYKLSNGAIVTIARGQDCLTISVHGMVTFEFRPKSETDFLCTYAPAEISFRKDAKGVVTGFDLTSPDFSGNATKL